METVVITGQNSRHVQAVHRLESCLKMYRLRGCKNTHIRNEKTFFECELASHDGGSYFKAVAIWLKIYIGMDL